MGTRTLLLVRHGQYAPDSGGRLTDVGQEQARQTGAWLATHLEGTRVDALWSSTLPRARETAGLIAPRLGSPKVRAVGVLREGMYSKIKGYEVPASEREEDRTRADAAYRRFFKTTRADRLEIVVCHGNLIRYLVCRALHVSVLRWTRMNSNHCATTRILVRDTGAVRVVTYNETAYLPPKLVT
jgi:serine/threonine-protein phosphatase PGAM5